MTEPEPDAEGSEVPDWAAQPISRFADQSERVGHVIRLSVEGISALTSMPKLVAALAKLNRGAETAHYERKVAVAEVDAELAAREIRTGFPILFSIAIVAEWSHLEEMVRSIVVAWLQNTPDIFSVEAIAKLRVRLGEYERLDPYDRLLYVVELLEAEIGAGVRNGVDRFESTLKPIGLDGAVPSGLRRDMFEFGQVRNAVVHRGGHADRQLIEACPWLGLLPGQELPISRDHFGRYLGAGHEYAILLLCRLGAHFGVDMSDQRDIVFTKYGDP